MSGVTSPIRFVAICLVLASLAGCRGRPMQGTRGHSTPNRPLPTHLGALLQHSSRIEADVVWLTLPQSWERRVRIRSGSTERTMVGEERHWVLRGGARIEIDQLRIVCRQCRIKWIAGGVPDVSASLVAQGGVTLHFAQQQLQATTLLVDPTTLQVQGDVTARILPSSPGKGGQ